MTPSVEPGDGHDALTTAAAARLAALPTPDRKLEDWRYVDTAPLSAGLDASRSVTRDELRSLVLPEHRALVVVDGRFHSVGFGDWPGDWMLSWSNPAALIAAIQASDDTTAVAGIAGAHWRQDLTIERTHPEPLRIVAISTGGASSWRLALRLRTSCELDLLVTHVALGNGRSTAILHLDLERGAQLRISETAPRTRGQLLVHADATIAKDAGLTWTAVGGGADLARWRLDARLAGEGASLDVATLDAVGGARQSHRLTRVVHAVGGGRSRQVVKNVLRDQARSSFDGVVRILPGADGSDADQQNRNLLLSPGARADARPQLDIRADEVKAAHGSTVGRLSDDEELYLRMRGLPVDASRNLLVAAFQAEVLDRLADPLMRSRAEESIA